MITEILSAMVSFQFRLKSILNAPENADFILFSSKLTVDCPISRHNCPLSSVLTFAFVDSSAVPDVIINHLPFPDCSRYCFVLCRVLFSPIVISESQLVRKLESAF
jgi:hypothetical protein